MKLIYSLTLLTNINSKWIKHLNIIPDTIKLLGETIGKKLLDIGLSNDVLDMTTKAVSTSGTASKYSAFLKCSVIF